MLSLSVRVVAAAAAGLITLAPGPAGAGPQPVPAIASPADDVASMNAWLADIAAWNTLYTNLATRRGEQILGLIDGGGSVIQLIEQGQKREARAWAENWSREQAAAFAALDAEFATLPPHPPEFPDIAVSSDAVRRTMGQQVAVRDRIGTFLRQSREISERFLPRVVTATSGRPDDLEALGKAIFELGIAQVEAENLMLENVRGNEGQPAYYFSGAMLESNRAVLAWMRFAQAESLGLPLDAPASAAQIRTHAADAEAAAADLKRTLVTLKASIDGTPELRGTPLAETLNYVIQSMYESAAVEEAIAAQLLRIADAVSKGDVDGSLAAADQIEPLIERRMALDQQRRARLNGA